MDEYDYLNFFCLPLPLSLAALLLFFVCVFPMNESIHMNREGKRN